MMPGRAADIIYLLNPDLAPGRIENVMEFLALIPPEVLDNMTVTAIADAVSPDVGVAPIQDPWAMAIWGWMRNEQR